jgi:hypothetical protein
MTDHHTVYLFHLFQESLDCGWISVRLINPPTLTIKPVPIGQGLQAFQLLRREIPLPHTTIEHQQNIWFVIGH